ncbi:hypothetical protein QTP86_017076 [Hemibagrus guttatus]|nr:hypothetical protein QTP86_017076 [Hemibagrus guttatus]
MSPGLKRNNNQQAPSFQYIKGTSAGHVTELMVDFIKQLQENFMSRFDNYSVPKAIIAFVLDPLSIQPSPESSLLARKTLPSLNEATFQMELIDLQVSSHVSSAL